MTRGIERKIKFNDPKWLEEDDESCTDVDQRPKSGKPKAKSRINSGRSSIMHSRPTTAYSRPTTAINSRPSTSKSLKMNPVSIKTEIQRRNHFPMQKIIISQPQTSLGDEKSPSEFQRPKSSLSNRDAKQIFRTFTELDKSTQGTWKRLIAKQKEVEHFSKPPFLNPCSLRSISSFVSLPVEDFILTPNEKSAPDICKEGRSF
jgi:hypothetical protein